ncbi:glycosyltransferase [Clostridium cadaveris]|uniref:glycosyltransferase n=1 Tax=Clostridium cadaveris TaxID=1529 RepID=UPI00040A1982|nr:glycosyltransferase [Clostridium cadaveris]
MEIIDKNIKYKIGICGHFGNNKIFLDGQTVKTKTFTEELERELGKENIKTLDSCGWKKNPVKLFFNCFRLIKKCENIVVLPAHNGVKVFIPLFYFLNRIFHKKLHYVVIGGWLPDLLQKNMILRNFLIKFDGIYVETNIMIEKLRGSGLRNVRYFPNFKRLDILKENELIYNSEKPYKLCTFSRVMEEKGIEDAIEAVKNINDHSGKIVYTLDIYGQINDGYKERFEKLKNEFPSYIKYGGCIEFNKSVDVLKNYFALLFPTFYEGEGFAGTILDAYASGIPVIASKWKYNNEIIREGKDGLLFNINNIQELEDILTELQRNPYIILNMKKECLLRARQFLPEKVIGKFIEYIL